ncbi:hypothetical protein ACIA58_23390 [Kribbella sp. NPDC051586]|uniref:hypothetical protein n=1 Tax=Kribbella sp. NPDC051586 TaxID=3364118 RepID=UPI0037B3D265
MTSCPAASTRRPNAIRTGVRSGETLLAALLGFFLVTLDAVIVNVALPSMGADLGGGIRGLQWVVDGYTLMFAAFLLASGVLVDRIGAKSAFGFGTRWRGGRWAASSAGPVLGGALTQANWRLIFLVNVPVGAVVLLLLTRTARSSRHQVGFVMVQRTVAYPMAPPDLFTSRTVVAATVIGFAFMVGYYGLPFTMSLYLQQAALMMLVGLGGPTVIPPVIALLLHAVPAHLAGTASGIFNTSRQVGGALAVAVFGALLAAPAGIHAGVRLSLLIAAAVAVTAASAALTGLRTVRPTSVHSQEGNQRS